MDFDFKTFSTRSFERFSQSMALHALGNGVLVFGDGPDGGREAVYEGKLNFPTDAENWSGYTVMQAKFLQVPGSPHEDADWLVDQLRTEFKKFTKDGSKLRKPDYYILVSNARLSPMPEGERGKGGIAKVNDVFLEYSEQLGIKDYRVWHLDQLCTMLMGADSLRRSYAAWLSSSDVIADLLADIHSRSVSVHDAMYRYLARELRSHQPIRLQQAGHSGNSVTMIEDVFTDLPFGSFHQGEGAGDKDKLLLASLLERSRDCLDSASVSAQQLGELGRPERILLLGGPGQGKSTLSQFLAQIFRANMLQSDRLGQFPADIQTIIDSTLVKANAIGVSTDVPRRFPFRVDLPSFADWLSKRDDPEAFSLLHYLSQQITNVSATDLNVSDLRSWIAKFPTILILDGLDEVPSSANRSIVLRFINELWDDAANSDLLMIVTTRPQGYNDDLDPAFYSKLELVSLSTEQAIHYAKKLAAALIVDPTQNERVLERLVQAAEGDTTARLLVSPLQVAIMLSLIDQRGDAPTDRWSLFDKYFAVMLQREQSKVGVVGQTMRHWGRQIAAIHYKAGFLLHVEAETPGHTEPQLSSSELKSLVRSQLADDGFEGVELERNTLSLIEVSTERMVLIVQRVEDRFSFEVRSLQEFMAAAYIMAGREAIVQKRLNVIANKAHWLHVFQIAASKCFAMNDSEQYRDTIVMICKGVNEGGSEIDRLLRSGSSLALALLDDGIAYDQPKYRRLLLNTAFEVLYCGASLLPSSLAQHCAREPSRTVELIRPYMSSSDSDAVYAAWKLLGVSSQTGQAWVEDILDEVWVDDPSHLAQLVCLDVVLPKESLLMVRLADALKQLPFSSIKSVFDNGLNRSGVLRKRALIVNFPCLRILTSPRIGRKTARLKLANEESGYLIEYTPIVLSDDKKSLYENFLGTEGWASLQALKEFHLNPTASSLAAFFENVLDNNWRALFLDMLQILPWPCSTLLAKCESDEDLIHLCSSLQSGEYGDFADWSEAEERWNACGITEADFHLGEKGEFFDSAIAARGWPLSSLVFSSDEQSLQFIGQMTEIAKTAKGAPREQLVQYLDVSLAGEGVDRSLDRDLANLMIGRRFPIAPEQLWVDSKIVAQTPVHVLNDEELLKRIDMAGKEGWVWLTHHSFGSEDIYDFLIKNSGRYPGLLSILVILVASNRTEARFKLHNAIRGLDLPVETESVVSACVDILKFMIGIGEVSRVKRALNSIESYDDDLPSWILALLLGSDCVKAERYEAAIEELAGLFNRNLKLPKRLYMADVKRFANSVRAELHHHHCWHGLEFGASLYALGEARRNTGLSV